MIKIKTKKCQPVNVTNSDQTYSETIASGLVLVLPDTTYNVYLDGVLQNTLEVPALSNQIINIVWQ
jgi:hypothetical protein